MVCPGFFVEENHSIRKATLSIQNKKSPAAGLSRWREKVRRTGMLKLQQAQQMLHR